MAAGEWEWQQEKGGVGSSGRLERQEGSLWSLMASVARRSVVFLLGAAPFKAAMA